MQIQLEKVQFMPKQLLPGVLYCSTEFKTCAHLCPCGCGSKVRTPLGPTEWQLSESLGKPTLHPSVGNWQLDCRSHYWIRNGTIEWSTQWTDAEIKAGRKREQSNRETYFSRTSGETENIFSRFWAWIKTYF